jgi:hypothetical protein
MIFTFTAGYSLSGPVWLVVKLAKKLPGMKENRAKVTKQGPVS